MDDKQLTKQDNSIFTKLKIKFFNLFNKKKNTNVDNTNSNITNNKTQEDIISIERKKEEFIQELSVNKNKRQRIVYIKQKT